MQDRYTDIQLWWPDVTTAAAISQGGMIEFVCKENAGITDKWLCTNVTPNITSSFGPAVGAILGNALLWACDDGEWQSQVPPEICHQIHTAFARLNTLDVAKIL